MSSTVQVPLSNNNSSSSSPPSTDQQPPPPPTSNSQSQSSNFQSHPLPPHHQQNSLSPAAAALLSPSTALEHYRLTQLYHYAMAAERLRCPPGSQIPQFMPPIPPQLRPDIAPFLYGPYCRIDPRLAAVGLCRPPEEPKPQHSYIGLIAMAILQSPDKKLVLSDIYQYILDNYPYFRARGPGWRNSIRHNLSLNDCFVKAGRSANGKGHYWAIHPANIDDFTKGDFRRRKAQRKVRKHMGLAVDDEDSPSPPPSSPPPPSWHPLTSHQLSSFHHHHHPALPLTLSAPPPPNANSGVVGGGDISSLFGIGKTITPIRPNSLVVSRKRTFDVASLLAPEGRGKDYINISSGISPTSTKSDDHDHESLSSPSPPPPSSQFRIRQPHHHHNRHHHHHSNNKNLRKTVESDEEEDGEEDEDATIQVEEEDEEVKQEPCYGEDENDNEIQVSSTVGVGQMSSHSNEDEDDLETHRRSPFNGCKKKSDNDSSRVEDEEERNIKLMSGGDTTSLFRNNNSLSSFEFLGNGPGGMLLDHGGGGGGGMFAPHPHHQLFQNNPSLASLMLLSSRYREFTNNLNLHQANKRNSH